MGKERIFKTNTKHRNTCDYLPAKKFRKSCVQDMPCQVCGDKARSHNYGGISCNCCRSFFQHFVLKNVRKLDSLSSIDDCKFQGNCTIDITTRRNCTSCRIFKCVKIGMVPAWVVSAYQKTLELKQQQMVRVKLIASPKLNAQDSEQIENILKYYNTACEQIPYNFPSREKNEVLTTTKLHILTIGVMSIAIRRFVCFARMIPEFNRLSLHDQTNLLRRSVIEMTILRDVVVFDAEKRTWSSEGHVAEKYPEVHADECTAIWPADLVELGIQFYKRIKINAPDESSVMLLIVVVLFSDYGGGEACSEFEDSPAINAAQEHYAALLQKYLNFVHGEKKGRLVFPRLLCQLMEVTEAAHLHQGPPMDLTEHQVNKMHLHLLELQKIANPSLDVNTASVLYPSTLREDAGAEKECCKKRLRGAKPSVMANNPSTEIQQGQDFPSLIHNFVRNPGEYGIKPYYFEKGPHTGIEKAFMRRMPTLVTNPLDSLVADVSKLSISCNDVKTVEFVRT
ncbi:thyroid hormone receptor alpha [Folsomia candida]|uniref:thyroid hormone receptor alpha n=1 Tax=Folsomia candida TaxID=158441 RepID=UPI000B8F59FA|nr:thyroid hormone receptor alpha [Folsomia candida]